MADVIHIGTATTLATVPIADCSNTDIAYIWLNSYTRKLIFDSTATDATDTTNHPYCVRPSDYGAGPGVWIESVGADQPEVWNANQIITGQLQSTNWAAAAGSSYDLDLAKFRLGGSNVDAAGAAAGVFMGLDSGAYKLYVGDGSTKYLKFDATNFTLNLVNLVISSANQTIKLGTGNDIISLDAADGTYRLAIGHATYASAPFRVTKAGAITSTSGAIGGWTLGATSLVSTNLGLHSGANAEILLGHATTYASAKIGLKNDGSGKLADGKIYWDASGNITLDVPANVGTGVGVVYKGGARWLYDFNPAHNGTVKPDGFNTFLGVECGNLAMGATADGTLKSSYNIGIGYQTLYSIEDGSYNTGVGYQTLYSLDDGVNNVGMGYLSLYALTSGSRNVGIGIKSVQNCTTGSSNVGVGEYAVYGTGAVTGDYNIGVGSLTLYRLTSGEHNIAIGDNAFGHLSTGTESIAIGSYSGFYQNDGSNFLEHPDNSIYIGRYSKSGSDPAGGEDVIDNEIVIGYNATGNGTNTFTLGNTAISALHCQVALTVDSDERIKRNISPSLVGLTFINALNPITFQRLNPFDYPDEIKPCNFKDRNIKERDEKGKEKTRLIKADKRPDDDNRVYLGLTAQQVEEVMVAQGIDLELVTTSNRGKKAITYGNLIMPLITAVQELSRKVELLEARI